MNYLRSNLWFFRVVLVICLQSIAVFTEASNPKREKKQEYPNLNNCPSSVTVRHQVGDGVSPETKNIVYKVVMTSVTGVRQCWITQNLGAEKAAVADVDTSVVSFGWYWQFNRKTGYTAKDTSQYRRRTWNSSISENSDWIPANDPCTLLLGESWRVPTFSEWADMSQTQGWGNSSDAFLSELKLATVGYLDYSTGNVCFQAQSRRYWSSSQGSCMYAGVFELSKSSHSQNL